MPVATCSFTPGHLINCTTFGKVACRWTPSGPFGTLGRCSRAGCVLCRDKWWDAEFAAGVRFTGDLLVAVPDVIEAALQEDDEFLVLATDGLWCGV